MRIFKQNRLIVVAIAMLVIGLGLSAFTLFYMVANQKAFETKLQNNIRNELSQYNFPESEEITPDEAELYLAVAKYCEANNNCKGPKGDAGAQGSIGLSGLPGLDGLQGLNGSNGLTPPCYFTESQCQGATGETGNAGAPAKQVERQCNADKRRIEWRLEGDTNWNIEYNLPPLATCETEGV